MKRIALAALVVVAASACVPKGRYDESLAVNSDLRVRAAELEQGLGRLETELQRSRNELTVAEAALEQTNKKLASKIAEAGALQEDVDRMNRALAEAEVRKARADESLRAYRDLVDRFQAMIDAGTLRVKVVDGRMVVELATDILFPAGSATLSREGAASIRDVAQVLASIPERRYQVAGHTDNIPISTERFPSNWDLGAARAISVTQLLADSGLAGDRVSAASYADFRPADTNRTPEGRKNNRRIEIIVIPDLSTLPGYEELQGMADGAF